MIYNGPCCTSANYNMHLLLNAARAGECTSHVEVFVFMSDVIICMFLHAPVKLKELCID